ncbi:MAG: hypothetical protein Alpg2KO_26480 [Alphaproteobacteria bacterium]
MTQPPIVTVGIPCFHAQETIARAVTSLLKGQGVPVTVVITADDSVDYRDVLDKAGIRDDRIEFRRSPQPRSGVSVARNLALAHAGTPFCAVLDADDVYEPGRLSALVPLAEAHGAALCNTREVLLSGKERLVIDPRPDGVTMMRLADIFASGTGQLPLFRTEHLGAGWREGLTFCEDFTFLAELMGRTGGPLPCHPGSYYTYIHREGSASNEADEEVTLTRAISSYQQILDWLAAGTLDLTQALEAEFRTEIEGRLQINQAYADARAAGDRRSFREFAGID